LQSETNYLFKKESEDGRLTQLPASCRLAHPLHPPLLPRPPPLTPGSPSPSKHPASHLQLGLRRAIRLPSWGSPNYGSLRRLLITARRLLQRLQRRCAKRRGSRASRRDCGGRVDPGERPRRSGRGPVRLRGRLGRLETAYCGAIR
ncbi:hypothetical protein U0070_025090, partial [Myodes glareolus]